MWEVFDKTNNFTASQHVRAASQWVRQSVKWVTPLYTSVITQNKVPCPSARIPIELCHILSSGLAWITPLNTVIWYAESLCALTTTPVSPYVHFRLVCENKTFLHYFGRLSCQSERPRFELRESDFAFLTERLFGMVVSTCRSLRSGLLTGACLALASLRAGTFKKKKKRKRWPNHVLAAQREWRPCRWYLELKVSISALSDCLNSAFIWLLQLVINPFASLW